MAQQSSATDLAFLVALGVSCAYLHTESGFFDACSRPIHWWQTASYACVVAFRIAHILGTAAADQSVQSSEALDFLLSLRHKGKFSKMLMGFTWLVALPFFTFWSALGTLWILQIRRETPECMPPGSHGWFPMLWLFLCYMWIVMHFGILAMACVLERRVRRAEASLAAVEDEDLLERWGRVSQLHGVSDIAGRHGAGLSPQAIRALPGPEIAAGRAPGEEDCPCSICISDFAPGDLVRRLPGCGHLFHRCCIDLWLVRRADCPLCKQGVCGECAS